ncbi:hypothetical protein FOMPIDRAFT_1056583 [Fomitopsis schrenkii]|uniref:F-box domain-containing protein n=1 Tax=Fomitopsis schrenkii TaxID=2126942 RepID=S8DIU3_FOMSC|nr:hypothetical protein FOMPIDRAFT_1056583 [Fomitopsis schrenkii]
MVFPIIPETDLLTRPLDVVALVCRHWRAVALAHPEWWGEMKIGPTTPPHVVKKWLERSKDTPLRLTLLDPRDEDFILAEEETVATLPEYLHANVRALRDHADRIEHFALSRHNLRITADILYEFSGVDAPRLRSLQVEPVFDEGTSMALFEGLFETEVFPGHTQGIRKLAIAHAILPLDPYLNLRELRLTYLTELTSGDLFSLLARSPALEIFELNDCIVDWPEDVIYPAKTVALPRLRRLQLEASQLEVLHTLSHLEFPATTRVDVTLEQRAHIDGREVVNEDAHTDIPENLGGASSSRDPIPHCHSLRDVASTIEDLTLGYSDGDIEHPKDFIITLWSPDVRLVATWRRSINSNPSQGGIWYDVLPLPAVERLRINHIPDILRTISQVEWRTFLGLMPSLRTIEVTHNVTFYSEGCATGAEPADVFGPMFFALSRPTPDPVTRVRQLPCPELHSVVFSHRSWGPSNARWDAWISGCNGGRRESGARRPIDFSFKPCMCGDCETRAAMAAAVAAEG